MTLRICYENRFVMQADTNDIRKCFADVYFVGFWLNHLSSVGQSNWTAPRGHNLIKEYCASVLDHSRVSGLTSVK